MATKYSDIFTLFKDKISDPDLLKFAADMQDEILESYMTKAIVRCNNVCSKDALTERDATTKTFTYDLSIDSQDIITEWMVVFWLEPYVNSNDNLKNRLSTKDFSWISPANLLEKISNRYELARKHALSLTSAYSYLNANLAGLKP